MEKKNVPKKPKFKVQIHRMWWAWYRAEGEPSMKKYVKKYFTEYFEVK